MAMASNFSDHRNDAGGQSFTAAAASAASSGRQLLSVYVTAVNLEPASVKIYVQFDKAEAAERDAAMAAIGKQLFTTTGPPALDFLPPDTNVVTHDIDTFHRAKVIHVDFTTQQITVFCTDHGLEIPKLPAHVRVLAGPQFADLIQAPPLSFCFILNNVRPLGNSWTRGDLDFMAQLLCYEDMLMSVVEYDGQTPPIVDLFRPNDPAQTISDILIQKGHAAAIIMSPLSFPLIEPAIGSETRVVLSYFGDGPAKFFVNMHPPPPAFQDMQSKLAVYNGARLANPKVGALCLASVQDGPAAFRICRSELRELKAKEAGALVLLVDYGLNVGIPVGALLELPPEFATFARQAIACTLSQAELTQLQQAAKTPGAISVAFEKFTKVKELVVKFNRKLRDSSGTEWLFEVALMNPETRESIATSMLVEFASDQQKRKAAFMQQFDAVNPQQQAPLTVSSGSAFHAIKPRLIAAATQIVQPQTSHFQAAPQTARDVVGAEFGATAASGFAVARELPPSIRPAPLVPSKAPTVHPAAAVIQAMSMWPGPSVRQVVQPPPGFASPSSTASGSDFTAPQLAGPKAVKALQQQQPLEGSGSVAAHAPLLQRRKPQSIPPPLLLPQQNLPYVQSSQGIAASLAVDEPRELVPLPTPQCFSYRQLKQRQREVCIVSHVNDPESFFVQLADNIEDLADLMASMQSAYANAIGANSDLASKVGVGSPCAFMIPGPPGWTFASSDIDNWFRGKIVQQSSLKFVLIQNVDYGTKHRVPLTNVRALKPDLVRIAPFAIQCRLYGVAQSGVWSGDEVRLFERMVADGVELHALFHEEAEPQLYVVELFTKEKLNLNVEVGRATNTLVGALAEAASRQPASQIQKQAAASEESVPQVAAATAASLPVVLTKLQVQLPSEYKVWVSFARSPSEFWIQTDGCLQATDDLQARLDNCYNNLKTGEADFFGPILKDQLCCARFKEDSKWYRALLTSDFVDGQEVNVYFVDFGNCDKVARSDIKQLLQEFTSFPEYALKCQISGIHAPQEAQWPQAVLDTFAALQGESISLRFNAVNSVSETYEVECVNESRAIIEKLVRSNLIVSDDASFGVAAAAAIALNELPHQEGASAPDETSASAPANSQGLQMARVVGLPPLLIPAEIGGTIDGVVVFTESTKNFAVRLRSQEDVVRNLQDELQRFYVNDKSTADTVLKGTLLAVKYSKEQGGGDGAWCRAVVVERLTPTKLLVHFMDHGETAEISRKEAKPLATQFRSLPPQAIVCALSGVAGNQAMTAKFDEVSEKLGHSFTVRIDGTVNERFSVTLLSRINGKQYNINDGLNQPSLLPV